MTITLQQAKDEAAREIGYNNWDDLIGMIGHKSLKELKHTQYELALQNAITKYSEAKAKEFAEWLHENRWYSFTGGKWNYTFENGTSISDATYEKNYRKTTEQLYETFKQSK